MEDSKNVCLCWRIGGRGEILSGRIRILSILRISCIQSTVFGEGWGWSYNSDSSLGID